jgi:hypothetical protein
VAYLLVGEDGDDGLLGDVLRFWFVWPVVPPAPDEPLELPVAPVPPLPALPAGRSQPARSAPESARLKARVSVRVSVPVMCGSPFGPEQATSTPISRRRADCFAELESLVDGMVKRR